MASVNPDVVQKLKNAQKLPIRQDGDGHEIEVREDEEQSIKFQEIIDLLVAAGYFRARIKGLSPFDKVVGGMTWCIESCNVDVDVDLLFQENSTIGQKIALTEKIVGVLPKIKCPHRIEPHQIQGLDFIHIFPVIQWLVKRSMEFRQERAAFVRSYAINQFNKDFPIHNQTKETEEKMLDNVKCVNDVYRPNRYYKRKNAPPPDIQSRVQITLLEYGHRAKSEIAQLNDKERKKEEEEILHNQAEEVPNYEDLNDEDKENLAKHYAMLQSELKDGGAKSREQNHIAALEEQGKLLAESILQMEKSIKLSQDNMKDVKLNLEETRLKQQEADKALKELEDNEAKDPESVKEVEELVILNENLRTEETQFREHCKVELVRLQKLIEESKNAKSASEETTNIEKELEEEHAKVKNARLLLAKKNRSVAALERQMDEVPNRAELAQYQRRFLELYNQVAAKHKETKQYYTLYNSLEDTRLYMQKELSLLNSISENYPEAMRSSAGKEEFIEQMRNAVEGVRHSRLRAERNVAEERAKRERLGTSLHVLVETGRKYVAALRRLGVECRRHEAALAQHNT
ncbi:coiled-coil domain-containing protein 93 isoform X2 [Aethina tumida]|uniref:coiled-coil domain-containing protein 93 isoform X2 n=1 Tax=Aethina tumida TaxID=116153 RepID=UPI002147756B|nr:coiled-coil domain-containing protein 93 isoform X2 [Aethina tumida]